jgi:hypothetical protein
MKHALLALSALLLLTVILSAQQISSTNYTSTQANATIASAYSYVNSVNESGYLIFQPNLTASYGYLSAASRLYNRSPDVAVFDALKAQQLAQQQYSDVVYGGERALPVMVAVTVILLIVLLKVMSPTRRTARKRG